MQAQLERTSTSNQTEVKRIELAARHCNDKGKPLDFANRLYLLALYLDNSFSIVIKKAVQMGATEWAIIDFLTMLHDGLNVLYVLPKYGLGSTFVHNRVDRIIANNPTYKQWAKEATGPADSVMMKHLAKGTVKFASAETLIDFIEYPADAVIIDEFDRCNPENIEYASDRLVASELQAYRWISTPSGEERGIDAIFRKSDMKEWHVKCEGCNYWQRLDFFQNVCRQIAEGQYELLDQSWKPNCGRDIQVVCKKCGKPIDRLSKGSWVAMGDRNSDISGYHLSHLFMPPAKQGQFLIFELWRKFKDAEGDEGKLQIFFNSYLGLAKTTQGAHLSYLYLDACKTDYLMPQEYYTNYAMGEWGASMGVDVGARLHVRISARTQDGKRRALYIGTVREFSDLLDLMTRYKVRCCVIDAYPETHAVKDFQKQGRGIWLCSFSPGGSFKGVQKNESEKILTCDRTQVFDQLIASIRKKELILPKNAHAIEGYYRQMQAPVRLYSKENDRNYYDEGSEPDHYFAAEVYDMIASQLVEANRVQIF